MMDLIAVPALPKSLTVLHAVDAADMVAAGARAAQEYVQSPMVACLPAGRAPRLGPSSQYLTQSFSLF